MERNRYNQLLQELRILILHNRNSQIRQRPIRQEDIQRIDQIVNELRTEYGTTEENIRQMITDIYYEGINLRPYPWLVQYITPVHRAENERRDNERRANASPERIHLNNLFRQHGARMHRPHTRLLHLVDILNHRNMQHGTPQERALLDEIERIKNILYGLGMSNTQIEDTIQRRLLAPDTDRPIHDTDLTAYFTPELAERTRREQELQQELILELERENEIQLRQFESNDEPVAAATSAPETAMDGESDEIDTIPAADIPKMITCPLCLYKIKDVRLNCGHLVCRDCARGLKQSTGICPVCRQPITTTEIVYYNKYLKYKSKYFTLKNKYYIH
jgi:hypothetical protein